MAMDANRRVSFTGDREDDGQFDEDRSGSDDDELLKQNEEDDYHASEEYKMRQMDILKERSEWELLMDGRAKKVKQGRAKGKKAKKKVQEIEILDFGEGDLGHRFRTHLDEVMMEYHLVKVKVKI